MMLRVAIILYVSFTCAAGARAQSSFDNVRSRSSSAAYYNYSEPGDITILVNVWGTVPKPGLYEVSQGMRLSRLLSLTGGPIVSPRPGRVYRTIHVRLFRDTLDGRDILFDTKMENDVFATREDPALEDGDVVTVETVVRSRFSWRDAFPIIAALGTVTLAIERLFR